MPQAAVPTTSKRDSEAINATEIGTHEGTVVDYQHADYQHAN